MFFRSFKFLSLIILTVFFLVYSGSIFCLASKSFAHCGKAHSDCEIVSLQKAPKKSVQAKVVKPAPNVLLAKLGDFYQSTKRSVYNFFEPFLPRHKHRLKVDHLPHAPPVA